MDDEGREGRRGSFSRDTASVSCPVVVGGNGMIHRSFVSDLSWCGVGMDCSLHCSAFGRSSYPG